MNRPHRLVAHLLVTVVVAALGVALAADSAEELIARLPRSPDVATRGDPVKTRLVELGDSALDALEKELRLDLHGHALQNFIDARQSRRVAVVDVLAAIPGDRSTGLLVRSLADYPDTAGMRKLALRALEERPLTDPQIKALLGNFQPDAVLLALRKVGTVPPDAPLREAVNSVFDADRVRKQFKNVFDAPTASDDDLWAVRLASGQAIGTDMQPEMRARAATIVEGLRSAVEHPSDAQTTEKVWNQSRSEIEISRGIERLAALGTVARDVVTGAAASSAGDLRTVLDLAAFAMGDADRLQSVTTTLLESKNPNWRLCAARVLDRVKDSRAIPALWKALEDPFHRERQVCFGPREQEYPVRELAARTLIALGEKAGLVRAKANEGTEK